MAETHQSYEGPERRKIDPARTILTLDQRAALVVANRFKGPDGMPQRPTDPAALAPEVFKEGKAMSDRVAVIFDHLEGKIDADEREKVESEYVRIKEATKTAASSVTETVEVDPRLATFKADYDTSKNPGLRAFPWKKIQDRLLADNEAQLNAALALNEGGILFGVDKNGNPLVCDRGDQPVMKGMNYSDTRQRVLFKHDTYDKKGQMRKDDSGQPIPTGYEMFPYVESCGKSDEILQYEAHTGRHFVVPPAGENYQSSWAESGKNPGSPENPSWPRSVNCFSNHGNAYVYDANPQVENPDRGVRRLLRVIKKA